jgi:hypothetical protein
VSGYRDENETLRARLEALERENETLRAVSARTTSREEWSSARARIFGTPFALTEERTLDARLDDALLEEILDVLRTRLSAVGTVTRTTLKGTVVWQCGPPTLQRIVEVTIKPEGDRTRVRIVERMGGLLGGLFGGIVGGAGSGIGVGLGVPILIELHRPWLLIFTLPATLSATWLAVRAGVRRIARGRERELIRIADEIAGTSARLGAVAGTRVAPAASSDDADLDDAELGDAARAESRRRRA